jgi:polar amino acid transport system substrate-binding protein
MRGGAIEPALPRTGRVSIMPGAIAGDLAPTGVLRASINLGNPVLAQGTRSAPTGVTVAIARELRSRLGRPLSPRHTS